MKVNVSLVGASLSFCVAILGGFYTAWAWNEFISPLGVPHINWASAVAIDSILMWLTNDYLNRKDVVVDDAVVIYLTQHLASSFVILWVLSHFNGYS